MKTGLTLLARVRFEPRRKGKRCLVRPPETEATEEPYGRLPRITRLMALRNHGAKSRGGEITGPAIYKDQ